MKTDSRRSDGNSSLLDEARHSIGTIQRNCESLGTAVAEARPFDSIHSGRPEDFVTRRILLAEDGVLNQRVAIDLLTKRGHQVTLATNGQEAVAVLEKQDFDLVLMDVQMPVMDGYAATAAIRKREMDSSRHLPIIAMTAHTMAGIVNVVSKLAWTRTSPSRFDRKSCFVSWKRLTCFFAWRMKEVKAPRCSAKGR